MQLLVIAHRPIFRAVALPTGCFLWKLWRFSQFCIMHVLTFLLYIMVESKKSCVLVLDATYMYVAHHNQSGAELHAVKQRIQL